MNDSNIILFSILAACYLLCLFPTNSMVHGFVVSGIACTNIKKEIRISSRLQISSEIPSFDAEVVEDDENEEDFNWAPDSEKARIAEKNRWKNAAASPADFYGNSSGSTTEAPFNENQNTDEIPPQKKKRLTYTDEEEDLIEILGGKDPDAPSSKRESGFLGDCTLKEIALDYQVPICYLGDVLCGWGVPPPIDADGMLGDMVTGEQAFAILEAIHTLDMGALNERYADYDLVTLCNEYDIQLADGFELAMKEGWNLPFGVRTFLRVEQEEHLIEKLAKDIW